MIPVLDLAVPDRVVNTIAWIVASRKRLITNEEIQVFCASFPC
jgi:hypothetical protein